MGADGSRIVAGGTDACIPAIGVEVVDTTGCGDAYSAEVHGRAAGVAGGPVGGRRGWGPPAATPGRHASLGSDAGMLRALEPGTSPFLGRARSPDGRTDRRRGRDVAGS